MQDVSSNGNSKNFVSYNQDSFVYDALYKNSVPYTHTKLFSNYKDSDRGIQVNTWNKVLQGDAENGYKLVDKSSIDKTGQGYVTIMDYNGNIVGRNSSNNTCLKILANDDSIFYSTHAIDSNNVRAYSIVVKPNDGALISWIAVDGVLRKKEDFKYTQDSSKGDIKSYNVITSAELNNSNSLMSHTIDVGFTSINEPSKKDGVYQISNYSELKWFRNYINSGKNNYAKAELVDDINASMSAKDDGWEPIGTDSYKFSGEFNGNNHVIENLTSRRNNHIGFFAYVDGAKIRNLKLKSVDFTAICDGKKDGVEQRIAGLVARVKDGATIENVQVDGRLTSAGHAMAGLIGETYTEGKGNTPYLNIKNCVNKVKFSSASCKKGMVAGIIACISEKTYTNIDNCSNYSDVHSNNLPLGCGNATKKDYAGGIVAYTDCHNKSVLKITDCNNAGEILGTFSGGIIGTFIDDSGGTSDDGAKLTIEKCNNFNRVCGRNCGGILGGIDHVSMNTDYYTIEWCNNYGFIGNASYEKIFRAGGIVGYLDDRKLKMDINYCLNNAPIFAGGGMVTDFEMSPDMLFGYTMTTYSTITAAPATITFIMGIQGSLVSSAARFASYVSVGLGILGAAFGVLVMLHGIVNDIIENDPFTPGSAGGIVGRNCDYRAEVNISNTINMGFVSAESCAGGIMSCTATQIVFANTNFIDGALNVYSVENHGNNDNTAACRSCEHQNVKDNTHYVSQSAFKSGQVAYEIQSSGKAGVCFVDGKEKATNVKNAQEKNNQVSLYGSQNNVYFGQNIDKYSNDKDAAPISYVPIYRYTTNDYKIYKYPKDPQKDSRYNGRVFYSNYGDLDTIASENYSKLNLRGYLNATSSDENPNNNKENAYDSFSQKEENVNESATLSSSEIINNDSNVSFANISNNLSDNNVTEVSDSEMNIEDNNNYDAEKSDNDEENLENSDTDEDNMDGNLLLKSDNYKLLDYFDIETTTNRSYGALKETVQPKSDKDKNEDDTKTFFKSYNLLPGETAKIVFKQKNVNGKKCFIKNIDFENSSAENQMESTTYYALGTENNFEETKSLCQQEGIMVKNGRYSRCLEDGSTQVLINPKYVVLKDGTTVNVGYDMEVLYKREDDNNLSVTCNIGKELAPDEVLQLDIEIEQGEVHQHKAVDTGKNITFLPWEESNCLPVNGGAYYLKYDVTLDDDCIVGSEKTYICTNGHSINLANHYIDLKQNSSNLIICNYDTENGNWNINCKNGNLVVDKDKSNEDYNICGALLYSSVNESSNFVSNQSLFVMDSQSKLYIDGVNVIQGNSSNSIIDIKDNFEKSCYSINLNCPIYEIDNTLTNDNDITTVINMHNAKHYTSDTVKSIIKYGRDYAHKNLQVKNSKLVESSESTRKFADIVIDNTQSTINVDFVDDYNFDKNMPIKVYINAKSLGANININLTSDFDKFIRKGVCFQKTFEAMNNDLTVALSSLETLQKHDLEKQSTENNESNNIKEEEKPKYYQNYLNNICICKHDDISLIKCDAEGFGKIYPNVSKKENDKTTDIVCKKGSDIKLHYIANEYAYLDYLQVYKYNSESFNIPINKDNDTVENIFIDKDTKIQDKELINRDISGKGSLVINSSKIVKDSKISFNNVNGNMVSGIVEDDVNVNSVEVKASFNSVKDIQIDYSDVKLWDKENYLPYDSDIANFSPKTVVRLTCDIVLDYKWNVPSNWKQILDLNGHYITVNQNSENVKWDNLISVNNKNTALTIVDSSTNANDAPEWQFIQKNDGSFRLANDNELRYTDNLKIKGGVIFGANTISNTYHKFDQTAGAIAVNSGILNVVSGSIACNYSNGRLGGAGITVKENGTAFLYENSRILNNICLGDAKYKDLNFAAGISCQGYVCNKGEISNNTAKLFSASAVSVVDGKFENSGVIKDNMAFKDTNEKSNNPSDAFCAVFVDRTSKFSNKGSITDNKANFECPAIINNGKMTIEGKNKICNNTWHLDKGFVTDEDIVTADIYSAFSNPIIIGGELTPEPNTASVIKNLGSSYKSLTDGWEEYMTKNKAATSDKIFKLGKDNKDNSVVAVNSDGELHISNENAIVTFDILYYIQGNDSLQDSLADINFVKQEKYRMGNYKFKVKAKENYKVSNIKIDDKEIEISKEHPDYFWYDIKGWEDQVEHDGTKVVSLIITVIPDKQDTKTETQANVNLAQNSNASTNDEIGIWEETNMLPESGKWKLQNDIMLEEPCKPNGDLYIDLNGKVVTLDYSILDESNEIKNKNKNILYVDSDINVTIDDSSIKDKYSEDNKTIIGRTSSKKHYLEQNADGGYTINDNSNNKDKIEIEGGVIGNTYFENSETSAAIFLNRGKLTFKAGNLVANNIKNNNEVHEVAGKGASSLYISKDAYAELGNKVSISYNYSQCFENDRYEYGAAAIEVRGVCKNFANITNNECRDNSVAGVAVIGENSHFDNYGSISNNTASKNSVAALLICDDDTEAWRSDKVSALNAGIISNNIAFNHSIAAVELYGVLNNTGEICKNIAKDEDSFAGIYSCGSLTLDGQNCRIYQNFGQGNSRYQDIIFDEFSDMPDSKKGYKDYAVDNYEIPSKALFTLGKDYNPKTDTYFDTQTNNNVPYSLTHISIKDFESLNKTLLIARGFLSNGRTIQKINEYFEVTDSKYDISATEDGNIYYHFKDANAKLEVTSSEGGQVAGVGTTITPKELKEAVPVDINANSDSVIKSIQIKDNEKGTNEEVQITDYKHMVLNVVCDSSSKNVDIQFTKSEKKDISYVEWWSNTALPSDSGSYKLMNDVILAVHDSNNKLVDSAWNVPKGTSQLDLNGHKITSLKGSVIKLNQNDTFLDIRDNKKDVYTKFVLDKKTGKYKYDANGNITLEGGVIYGSDSDYGAIVVGKDTFVGLHDINIAGNNAKFGGAVYNEGEVLVDQNTLITGNTAQIGAGVYNTANAKLILNGTIAQNIATEMAGGIFADGELLLYEHSVIGDNEIRNENTKKENSANVHNNDFVFIEFKDKNGIPSGSIVQVAAIDKEKQKQNKVEFNNLNMVAYISCISNEEKPKVLYNLHLPAQGNSINFASVGTYVFCSENNNRKNGIYNFEINKDETNNKKSSYIVKDLSIAAEDTKTHKS